MREVVGSDGEISLLRRARHFICGSYLGLDWKFGATAFRLADRDSLSSNLDPVLLGFPGDAKVASPRQCTAHA
jgi:hypothetical protein